MGSCRQLFQLHFRNESFGTVELSSQVVADCDQSVSFASEFGKFVLADLQFALKIEHLSLSADDFSLKDEGRLVVFFKKQAGGVSGKPLVSFLGELFLEPLVLLFEPGDLPD